MRFGQLEKLTVLDLGNHQPQLFSNGVAKAFHCGWRDIGDSRNRSADAQRLQLAHTEHLQIH